MKFVLNVAVAEKRDMKTDSNRERKEKRVLVLSDKWVRDDTFQKKRCLTHMAGIRHGKRST